MRVPVVAKATHLWAAAVACAACYRAAPLDETAMLLELKSLPAGRAAAPGRQDVPAGGPLTEERAVEAALESSPRVAVARAGVSVAEASLRRAGAWRNPEVRVTNLGFEQGSAHMDRMVFALRAFPPHPVEAGARADEAEADVLAARARAEDAEWRTRHDVRSAYRRAVAAGRGTGLAERLVEVKRRTLDLDREAVARGVGDPRTLAADRIELAAAEEGLRVARKSWREAMLDLASSLGLASTDGLVLDQAEDSLACPEPLAGAERLEEIAARGNPRLQVERAVHARAEATLRREYARRIPWFAFVQAGYDFDPEGKQSGFHGGLALDLPVWNWNSGGIAMAEAARTREAARFRETLASVVLSVRRALEEWRTAHERLGRIRSEVLPLAEQAERDAASAAAAGRLAERDLLAARARLLEVEQEVLDATLACSEAALDLEYALGAPIP